MSKQIEAGSANTEALQRGAVAYAALGRSQEAVEVLEKLVDREPGSSSAWGMLVGLPPPVIVRKIC